jgi:TetR/AcrR family transcriptional regulator, mexCD-oprJ operon repressor
MTQGHQVRDHINLAILEAAASVIGDQGESASMTEVAEAAGISRATLYRYFASREDLLRALSAAAIEDARLRLVAADLESVPVPEAVARLARAMVGSAVNSSVILAEPQYIDKSEAELKIGVPIRALLQRGMDDGTLRNDLPLELLGRLWGGLLAGAVHSMNQHNLDMGVEGVSAAVADMFLRGAGRAPD